MADLVHRIKKAIREADGDADNLSYDLADILASTDDDEFVDAIAACLVRQHDKPETDTENTEEY